MRGFFLLHNITKLSLQLKHESTDSSLHICRVLTVVLPAVHGQSALGLERAPLLALKLVLGWGKTTEFLDTPAMYLHACNEISPTWVMPVGAAVLKVVVSRLSFSVMLLMWGTCSS